MDEDAYIYAAEAGEVAWDVQYLYQLHNLCKKWDIASSITSLFSCFFDH